jgi:DNA-binding NarL/FixJ family response regulator
MTVEPTRTTGGVAERILIADDHVVVRQGLRAVLEQVGFRIVADVSTGAEAVEAARSTAVDVALLDVSMPGMDGIEAVRRLLEAAPATRSILLTRHASQAHVLTALRAGARGYVLKSEASADIVRAIHVVHRGELCLSPGVSRLMIDAMLPKPARPADQLTRREREVLRLIGRDRTTRQIAVELGIGLKTAEAHRTRLMQKLGVHSAAGLVRRAIQAGFIEP